MSKGILGIGCSFTWGESLYFYSDLEDLPLGENHNFDSRKVRNSMIQYKNKHRFLRIVADELDTWEYTSDKLNGGCNIETYFFTLHSEFIKNTLKKNDFKLVVWQITDPFRDSPLGTDYIQKLTSIPGDDWEERYEYQTKLLNSEVERQLHFIDRRCKEFEDLGCKVVTFSWWKEFYEHKLYQKNFKERHVPLYFGNKKVNYFNDLIWDDSDPSSENYNIGITVANDFMEMGLQKNDKHFNKKGHKYVADSILKKLKNDKFI